MLCGRVSDLVLPDVGSTASLHGHGETVVVLGHGAGGNRRTPMLLALADALARSGRAALLYNFPYAERRGRRPDPPGVLEGASRAAARLAVEKTAARHVVHGGRSLGGRIASQIVAAGEPAAGLVLLAYPLHPPGRPEQLRDGHLARVAVPMLFVQGTRDAFARPDLLAGVLSSLGERATLHSIEGGDHSFGVPRRGGRTPAQVEAEVVSVIADWLSARGV